MKNNFEIIELTKDNEQQYLQDVVELEKKVLRKMEDDGKVGQLFITGEEGIKEYAESNLNHVMIAVKNDSRDVISAAYITHGQIPFTYNDITKYFKCNSEYQDFVKSQYSPSEFRRNMRDVYIEKICAYKYARNVILHEQGICELCNMSEEQKNEIFLKLVENELANPNNQFHEKSQIRENLNKYMSMYMEHEKKDMKRYEEFYWMNFKYLKDNLDCVKTVENKENYNAIDSNVRAYDKVLNYQKYKIYDSSYCINASKYYSANTSNTIELDTYITHPQNREGGIARILTFEGIKKSIDAVLKNEDNKEVFLVSTLHEDNLSSKYVSEFFGLEDYLFVNRRNGRDRQVHINAIPRDRVSEYLSNIEKRLVVLYGYNPNNIKVTDDEKKDILKKQIQYETRELNRLNSIKKLDKREKFKGYIKGKQGKIAGLQKLVNEFEKSNHGSVGNIYDDSSSFYDELSL